MIEGLSRFRGEGKVETWILGIANNVCREFRRLDQRWPQSVSETPEIVSANEFSPEQNTSHRLEAVELRGAVEQLSQRQRTAIVLRYFESLPLKEVAEVMEVSVGTVKATLHQAMKRLKLQFKMEDV